MTAARTEKIDAVALTGWLREAADATGMDDLVYTDLLRRIARQVDEEGYVEARVVRCNYARVIHQGPQRIPGLTFGFSVGLPAEGGPP